MPPSHVHRLSREEQMSQAGPTVDDKIQAHTAKNVESVPISKLGSQYSIWKRIGRNVSCGFQSMQEKQATRQFGKKGAENVFEPMFPGFS